MKDYDRVRLIRDRADYNKRGIHKGDVGTIMMGEERHGYVLVLFDGEICQDENGVYYTTDIDIGMRVEDLEVIRDVPTDHPLDGNE